MHPQHAVPVLARYAATASRNGSMTVINSPAVGIADAEPVAPAVMPSWSDGTGTQFKERTRTATQQRRTPADRPLVLHSTHGMSEHQHALSGVFANVVAQQALDMLVRRAIGAMDTRHTRAMMWIYAGTRARVVPALLGSRRTELTAIDAAVPCWYVAYGSNMDLTKLRSWISCPASGWDDRWLQLPRRVYFAGESRTWGGPVAFLSLQERTGALSHCRAVRVTEQELATIFHRENGVGALPVPLADLSLNPGEWRHVLVSRRHAWQGKYNVLLRLEDIDGVSAYTLTTDRVLHVGRPMDAYLDVITAALANHLASEGIAEYRVQLGADASGDNREHLATPVTALWSGVARRGGFAGFPVVRLPSSCAPVAGPSLYIGRLTSSGRSLPTWVSFSLEEGEQPQVSFGRALGWEVRSAHSVLVQLEPMTTLRRRPGLLTDIPDSDVVQVSVEEAAALGRWAVAATPHFTGAMRVQASAATRPGEVRLAYAARTLLTLGKDDVVVLQPLSDATIGRQSRIRRSGRSILEWLLGAPPLALRATEGLVGDDGRNVARVDATALEFLGMQSGGTAILSWGPSSTIVRLLAQTGETRECMAEQLGEATGRQTRASLTDVASRLQTPQHLRIWVSSNARKALGIPPDTVVRVRRSLPHLCMRQVSYAALPAAGLIIAALAVPNVAAWVWVLATLLVVALVALPLRRT